MKNKGLDLNFLKDSPALKGDAEYYEFYHDHISPTLNKITSKQKNIHTIGLFGNWGSGKSTIIENLKKDYKDSPLFMFDVWKYRGDPLRRTFLLKFYSFVDANNLWKKGKKIENTDLDSLYETKSISENVKKPNVKASKFQFVIKFLLNNIIVLALGVLLVSWLLLQLKFGDKNPFINTLLQIVGYTGQSTAFIMIFGWMLKKFVDNLMDRLFNSLNKDVEHQTVIKTREYLNSPEQFEEKFLNIVSALNKKIIVVFDNIDRVQGDAAIEILSAIKTFIEPGIVTNIVFIIPCDSGAIEEQIKQYYGKASTNIDPSEYLRKLFNVVIWTPDFISTDLEDFTKKQIEQLGNDKKLLTNNDDLIRVITQAFKSPREIKQFLNNLIAAILVASSTDVWNEVKENIPYLAKVLVLKQKYPTAYKRLKDKWYKPEDILEKEDGLDLRAFMVSTSTIQVANAEPYIYFKISNSEKQFADSKLLLPALAAGNLEETIKIITNNSNSMDKLLGFILSLYGKYQNQEDWLTKIITTFLSAISELKTQITNKDFFNHTAEVIEKYIWQNYKLLDTDIIFNMFILNDIVKKEFRDALLERYITAFGSQELTQEPEAKTAREILKNLLDVKDIPDEQLSQIRTSLEAVYFDISDIASMFADLATQKKFVSKNALEKFIQGLNIKSLTSRLPHLVTYKEFINNISLGDILITTLNALIPQERVNSADHNSDKIILFERIGNLIEGSASVLINVDLNLIAILSKETILSYGVVTDINNKGYFIPVLYRLNSHIHETNPDIEKQADNLIAVFIKTASIESVNAVLNAFDQDERSNFVNYYNESFKERAINSSASDVEVAYQSMDLLHQQEFINILINQTDDAGLSFILSREVLPDRNETIKNIITRAQQLHVSAQRDEVCDWLASSIKKDEEDVQIIESAIEQIKTQLKSEISSNQQYGYRFLTSANFLSKEQKALLGEEIINWLTEPGRIVTEAYAYILKAVAFLLPDLTQSSKEQFINIIFHALEKPNNREINIVALGFVQEFNLRWNKNKIHYEEFKDNVAMWSNAADRDYIITELINNIKPEKPSKKEQIYWSSLEDLMNQDGK